jgi:hypothetical protein
VPGQPPVPLAPLVTANGPADVTVVLDVEES